MGGISYGFSGILEYERISAEDGSNGNLELHLCKVLSHTRPVGSEDRFVSLVYERLSA